MKCLGKAIPVMRILLNWTAEAAFHALSSSKKTSVQRLLSVEGMDTISENNKELKEKNTDNAI